MKEIVKPSLELKKQFFPEFMHYLMDSSKCTVKGCWHVYSVAFKITEKSDGSHEFTTSDERIILQ